MILAKDIDDVTEHVFDGIEIWVTDDQGCCRTPNGDGRPPSTSVEIVPDTVSIVADGVFGVADMPVGHEVHDTRRIDHYDGPGTCDDEPATIQLTATLVEWVRLPNERLVARFVITESTA